MGEGWPADGSSVEWALQFYDGGVFQTDECAAIYDRLNHAVTIVGFGTDPDSGLDYFLVKNSWGEVGWRVGALLC